MISTSVRFKAFLSFLSRTILLLPARARAQEMPTEFPLWGFRGRRKDTSTGFSSGTERQSCRFESLPLQRRQPGVWEGTKTTCNSGGRRAQTVRRCRYRHVRNKCVCRPYPPFARYPGPWQRDGGSFVSVLSRKLRVRVFLFFTRRLSLFRHLPAGFRRPDSFEFGSCRGGGSLNRRFWSVFFIR